MRTVDVVINMYTILSQLIAKCRVIKADRVHRGRFCTCKATSISPKQRKMVKLPGAVKYMSLEVIII